MQYVKEKKTNAQLVFLYKLAQYHINYKTVISENIKIIIIKIAAFDVCLKHKIMAMFTTFAFKS